MLRIVHSGTRSAARWPDARVPLRPGVVRRAQSREEPPKNPFQPNPTILQEGMAAFRANCAYCHGMDGRGARGPDLTGIYPATPKSRSTAGAGRRSRHRDAAGQRLSAGTGYLEGADVPADAERAAAAEPPPATPRTASGSSGRVRQLPSGQRPRRRARPRPVAHRHRADARRARAPDPRRGRRLPSRLRAGDGHDAEGRTVRGTRKNEDLFSVQVMDSTERLQGYVKSDVQDRHRREALADAGVRRRPAERERSRRPDQLLWTLRGAVAGTV